jgi:tRNA (mo5U34)-methyltransferase
MFKLRRLVRRPDAPHDVGDDAGFQFAGFTEHRVPTRYVDFLSDQELLELNAILRWNCFTVDAIGRRFGRRAWRGKREAPQPVPDPRIVLLDQKFGLADKHVLEVGCFEGVHTIGLVQLARQVTAVDSRIANVVKTMVRCGFFGAQATVFKCDLERAADIDRLPQADVLHHVGVLYHLLDPASHLLSLHRFARFGVMLDTHYALDAQATRTYRAGTRELRYRHYHEGGAGEVFSGMGDHAKWLRLDDILALLREAGFVDIEVVERREERNGARVLLFARRSASAMGEEAR